MTNLRQSLIEALSFISYCLAVAFVMLLAWLFNHRDAVEACVTYVKGY